MGMQCLAQGVNTVSQVRFEAATLRSRVRRSTNWANGAQKQPKNPKKQKQNKQKKIKTFVKVTRHLTQHQLDR